MRIGLALFIRDTVHRNNPLADFSSQGFDQIRVGGPAGHDPLHRGARLIPLTQDDGGVWQIRTRHDDIGFGIENFLQFAAIARAIRLVGDV